MPKQQTMPKETKVVKNPRPKQSEIDELSGRLSFLEDRVQVLEESKTIKVNNGISLAGALQQSSDLAEELENLGELDCQKLLMTIVEILIKDEDQDSDCRSVVYDSLLQRLTAAHKAELIKMLANM